MLGKVWEAAALCIVLCLAAHLVLSTVAPFLPIVIGLAIVISVIATIYHRKRRW